MSLAAALERLGFVQADPIRAPARAQDLILRHRVVDYRADDLERRYQELDVEEAYFYAYGFMSRTYASLLHPRKARPLGVVERLILASLGPGERVHPRELEVRLQRGRTVNAWGGYSSATTRALERLHHRGLVRVAHRAGGVRVYEAVAAAQSGLPAPVRMERLALLLCRIFAPEPLVSLRQKVAFVGSRVPRAPEPAKTVSALLKRGACESFVVDGATYVRPADALAIAEAPDLVRFLAPFDPIVWNRRRFELLWGWRYRFEAYVPAPKRALGYYAMPLLWRDDVVGWVNVTATQQGFSVERGFAERRPRERAFAAAFDAEVERMRAFLGLP